MGTEFEGAVDILFSAERGMTIEVKDANSGSQVFTVNLPADQIAKMLSSRAHLPCMYTVERTDISGKHEHRAEMSVELPEGLAYGDREAVAERLLIAQCPEGWETSCYLGSKDSFYKKGDRSYAKTIIRTYRSAKPDEYTMHYFKTDSGDAIEESRSVSLCAMLQADMTEALKKGHGFVIRTSDGARDGVMAVYMQDKWEMYPA